MQSRAPYLPLVLMLAIFVAACSSQRPLNVADGFGKQPVLPNGDVLVAETNAPPRPAEEFGLRNRVLRYFMHKAGAATPSANRITLLRDTDADGVADVRAAFLENLHSPFGMVLVGDDFYVANTDAVVRFPYQPGQQRIDARGVKVIDLPAGPRNHHWTKGLTASPDGTLLYATVGSNSNVAEHGMAAEAGRAAIWQVDPRSGHHRIFATGLRNANGLAWEPLTGALWTTVIDGRPAAMPRDVLDGFVDDRGDARGRPTGVALDTHGNLLVADDVGNTVWLVTGAALP